MSRHSKRKSGLPVAVVGSLTGAGLIGLATVNGLVPMAFAAPDRDCPSFATQSEAQLYFNSIGGSSTNNADLLDDDGDGIACEGLPVGEPQQAGDEESYPVGGVAAGGW